MRKVCFYATLLLLAPITGIAQSVNDQYLSQSFREAFNLDGIRNLLASSQFQFLLIGTIVIVVAIWLFYLWGSLKMAYENLEINIFRRISRSLRPRITPPDFDLPHLHDLNAGRMGFAPSLIAVEHSKEKEEKKEESAARGDTTPARG